MNPADKGADGQRLLVRVTRSELLGRQQATLLELLAELLDAADLERALDAFVATLQQRLGATRVALSLVADDGNLTLGAISQLALVDVASDEARLLLEAMEEALDRERSVCHPEPDAGLGVSAAHRTLGTRRERTALASVPLYLDGEPFGALLLERHDAGPFAAATLELLERIGLAVAPLLALRREAERGPLGRTRVVSRRAIGRRFGKGREGARLLLALGVVALGAAMLVPLPQRISAAAELVPQERRLVTAPLDGFVEEVAVEAGESVVAGQLLARLDRRELELERARRDGEIAGAEAEFRTAMASHDRQATAVARARLERERALRELVEQRLARGELRAPITGLVVSGDPADAVGMPVTRGEALFEIAPRDGYEVHLMVHERDIREAHEGQRGTLSLRSRPRQPLALRVLAIHPVAESADGASRFRVRASLEVPPGVTPRPGESGVARLEAGRASLVGALGRAVAQRLSELWWKVAG